MNNLEILSIPVGNEVHAVSARDLHERLEVGRDFSNWIKQRISTYDFVEGEDYIIDNRNPRELAFAQSGERQNQGLQRVEYFVTLDMAKELAMIENNSQGRVARRYFINCEKELRTQQLDSKVEALRIEYRDAAEQAIQHNTQHVELLGISLHNGITSAQRSALYKVIDEIAHSTEDPGATNNAISSHLYRRYMRKGWLGQVLTPFNDAMDYLQRVKKAYETGYRPTYKRRLLVIEDGMLNL